MITSRQWNKQAVARGDYLLFLFFWLFSDLPLLPLPFFSFFFIQPSAQHLTLFLCCLLFFLCFCPCPVLSRSLSTIVFAVEEGRRILDNIVKFLVYLLSCNGAEVMIMLLSVCAGWEVPYLPLMILVSGNKAARSASSSTAVAARGSEKLERVNAHICSLSSFVYSRACV